MGKKKKRDVPRLIGNKISSRVFVFPAFPARRGRFLAETRAAVLSKDGTDRTKISERSGCLLCVT